MKPGLPVLAIGILLLAQMVCCISGPGTSPTPGPLPTKVQIVYTYLPPTSPPAPTTAPETPIGSITRISDNVLAGPENSLSSVNDNRQLYDNDAVHVANGGKAFLEMGNGVNFTLFNDTITNQTRVDNISLEVWMNLSQGGLRGINPPGSRTEVSLLGNVKVVILGTSYFIVSDPDKDRAWIYNYDGTIQYSFGGGQTQALPARTLLEASSQDIIQIFPNQIYSVDDFDQYASSWKSPIQGFKLLFAHNQPTPTPTDTPQTPTEVPLTPQPTTTTLYYHLPPILLLPIHTNTPTATHLPPQFSVVLHQAPHSSPNY